MSGTKLFDKLLEKSTNALLLEPDWDSILKICDLIRQGDVQAKYAVSQLKKKLCNDNIHVVSFSLQCMESMVKNCGSKVHLEVANKDFMDMLKELSEVKPDPVKTKILELIQCWSHAFKKNPNLKIVEDYYTALKFEGAKFPRLNESEAMFDVEEAPQWIHDSDANECLRCRTEFGPIRRRHHCRACGQIFCHACSSKTAPIPKFGIEKEVRVCDACYDKLMGVSAAVASGSGGMSSSSSSSSGQVNPFANPYGQTSLFGTTSKSSGPEPVPANLPNINSGRPAEKTEQEFEEELQLALALSESEAEANKKQQKHKQYTSTSSSSKSATSNSSSSSNLNITAAKNNGKSSSSSSFSASDAPPSAPYAESAVQSSNKKSSSHKTQVKMPVMERQPDIAVSYDQYDENGNGESAGGMINEESEVDSEEARTNREIVQFRTDLKRLLDIYVNRMKSDSMRGRSITNDTAVQSLFLQLQHLHPRLLAYIKYKEDARAYYELLQDKLTQLKDAREALNALRQETYEKKRLEMEERERQRQLQIAHKLQLMRAQKQSYYMMQNQANLRRLQEQEHDLRTRLEQQRDMVQKREINTTSVQFMSTNQPVNPMMSMPGQMAAHQMMPGGYVASGPGGMIAPGMDMHMIESSLESLRLQQAYLMQQQQMSGMSQQVPPVNQQTQQYQTSWKPSLGQQQAPQLMIQQPQQVYYDQQQMQSQVQQPQQQQQQHVGYAQPHPQSMQQVHAPPTQAAVPAPAVPAPQVQEQPKVAELISFD